MQIAPRGEGDPSPRRSGGTIGGHTPSFPRKRESTPLPLGEGHHAPATNAVGASLVGALTASPILSILSIHVNSYPCEEGAGERGALALHRQMAAAAQVVSGTATKMPKLPTSERTISTAMSSRFQTSPISP